MLVHCELKLINDFNRLLKYLQYRFEYCIILYREWFDCKLFDV